MNMWRVGEDMGSKETDGCPLTAMVPESYQRTTVRIKMSTASNTLDSLFHAAAIFVHFFVHLWASSKTVLAAWLCADYALPTY
jgi:hypothetical protein